MSKVFEKISVSEELLNRIERLRRSEEDTLLTVIQRAIYKLEGHEMLHVVHSERVIFDRPIIPAVKEAMLSGELTRKIYWFKEWREPEE